VICVRFSGLVGKVEQENLGIDEFDEVETAKDQGADDSLDPSGLRLRGAISVAVDEENNHLPPKQAQPNNTLSRYHQIILHRIPQRSNIKQPPIPLPNRPPFSLRLSSPL